MKFVTKPIQQCLPHRRHVDTLRSEIKHSNFLHMWKNMQTTF